MKPIYMSKKRHPFDKSMLCPKCGTKVFPDHYDDGERVEIGSPVDNDDYIGQGLVHEVESTCYTPMWLCHECLHTWDIEDLEKGTLEYCRDCGSPIEKDDFHACEMHYVLG
jgi:DNA-directed RNA polymerase subunit RPC12/RpoP